MVIKNLKQIECANIDAHGGKVRWRYYMGFAPENKKKKIVLVSKNFVEFENYTQEDVIFQSFEDAKELLAELKRRVKQVLFTETPKTQNNYKWAYESN